MSGVAGQPGGVHLVRPVLFVVIVALGLLCAVIGLLGIRKHGTKGILVRSIIGLFANAILLVVGGVGLATHLNPDLLLQAPVAAVSPPTQMKPIAEVLSVVPPPGFAEVFPQDGSEAAYSHQFIKGDLEDASPKIAYVIEPLGGTIGKDEDLKALMGERPDLTFLEVTWQGHEIDVVRVEEQRDGYTFVILNAQLPTIPEAVQVKVLGVKEREGEVRKDLKSALAGIKAPTNW